MGLFGKKKRDSESESSKEAASSRPTFKGDLGIGTVSSSGSTVIDERAQKRPRALVGDSRDAVVYFASYNGSLPKDKWICSACGTLNRQEFNACEVCGMRR